MEELMKNKGFSMIEILVSLGLLSGVILSVLRVVELKKNFSEDIKIHDDAIELPNLIFSYYSNHFLCNSSLSGKKVGSEIAIQDELGKKLQKGEFFLNSKIESLKITTSEFLFDLDPYSTVSILGTVSLISKPSVKRSFKFDILVSLDSTDTVIDCVSDYNLLTKSMEESAEKLAREKICTEDFKGSFSDSDVCSWQKPYEIKTVVNVIYQKPEPAEPAE